MSHLSGSWLVDIGFFLGSVILVVYVYFDWVYKHWKRRGVPYVQPTFIFGNISQAALQRKHIVEAQVDLYKKFSGERYAGVFFFAQPVLMVRDLDLAKNILVKDFDHFHDHDLKLDEDMDPLLGKMLFSAKGKRWRELRVKLSPTFTSGKMKRMFHLMVACAEELKNYLEEPAATGEVIECKDILSRMTSDVIGSCAFGVQCNAIKDPSSEFLQMGKKLFQPSSKLGQLKMTIVFFIPALANVLRIRFIEKKVEKFFRNAVVENMEYRAKNNVIRNDFMDLLIQLKKKGYVEVDETDHDDKSDALTGTSAAVFSDDDVAAQALSFFSAGFETSATTMNFALYELAVNPDIQERLRGEIETEIKKQNGDITYEGIQQMQYLDKVVSETLRKHPPASDIGRECLKEYPVPGTTFTVEKGTSVHIPVYAIHHDPNYYPNPEKFDPERFNDEHKRSRPNYSYLPFGEGPRICIGMRFALLQIKVGLVVLLLNFDFRVSAKTPIPLKLDPGQFMLAIKGGNWLQIVKRKASS